MPTTNDLAKKIATEALKLPWVEILAEGWRLTARLWNGLAHEGIYDVLEYECTLELLNKKGSRAKLHKRKKIRYAQNNIVAYQDWAWADGEYPLNYQCSPGTPVDFYRPANQTLILIALRQTKQRGEVDEFNINWEIKDGFIRPDEQWETDIDHRTKRFTTRIILPKSRPPKQAWLIKKRQQSTMQLDHNHISKLADGRWQIEWKTNKPRLYESYILKWEW